MHHFLPLARLFEHLGDENFLTATEVSEMLAAARMLTQQGFSADHIIEALLCWQFYRNPKLRSEVDRFRENEEEHHKLAQLRIPKVELLNRIWPHLNGERNDIEVAFADVTDETLLSSDQAIYHIPPHHPKAIDALVLVFLGHAKAVSPSYGGLVMKHLTRRMLRHFLTTTKLVGFDAKESLLGSLITKSGNHGDDHVFTIDEVVDKVFVGYHELQQDAMHRDWQSHALPEDYRAIERFLKHEARRPAAAVTDTS